MSCADGCISECCLVVYYCEDVFPLSRLRLCISYRENRKHFNTYFLADKMDVSSQTSAIHPGDVLLSVFSPSLSVSWMFFLPVRRSRGRRRVRAERYQTLRLSAVDLPLRWCVWSRWPTGWVYFHKAEQKQRAVCSLEIYKNKKIAPLPHIYSSSSLLLTVDRPAGDSNSEFIKCLSVGKQETATMKKILVLADAANQLASRHIFQKEH